ncbi:uncharacterized protein LOC110911164 isoform X2 [Helianthus annuus]|uniref:uncharacterized protein LOC110911164 isoform X2 n=1 Tax=Helianthus annuus TaxID=4232 RepID=UPI000B90074E|nr:uncharacterized protein LOC110911164 isoform X2 [Helianthus annuus]
MSDDFRCTMEHHLLGKYNCFVFSSFLMSNYFRCAMQHHLSEVHRLQLLFWLYMLFLGSPFLEFMTKREGLSFAFPIPSQYSDCFHNGRDCQKDFQQERFMLLCSWQILFIDVVFCLENSTVRIPVMN